MGHVPTDAEVVELFTTYWAPLVMKGDQFDTLAVARELYDYWIVVTEVSRVYGHVTGGRLTKPNTAAFHIIAAHDEAIEAAYQEGFGAGQEDVASVTRIHGVPD